MLLCFSERASLLPGYGKGRRGRHLPCPVVVVVGRWVAQCTTNPRHNRIPPLPPFPTIITVQYYSTTRKHGGRTRLTTSASAAGGLVDRQQYCFMSLPKRSRRSRYRGPACCTTHNYGPMCTTHTGRLIQVTVCELDGILSFGPSAEATAIQPATPTGPEMEHTTRQPPRHDALRLEPRRPSLGLGLGPSGGLTSYGLISLPGPSPHIQRVLR